MSTLIANVLHDHVNHLLSLIFPDFQSDVRFSRLVANTAFWINNAHNPNRNMSPADLDIAYFADPAISNGILDDSENVDGVQNAQNTRLFLVLRTANDKWNVMVNAWYEERSGRKRAGKEEGLFDDLYERVEKYVASCCKPDIEDLVMVLRGRRTGSGDMCETENFF